MNYVGEKEIEKTKEAKKAPSTNSFEAYEDEAMEGFEDSLGSGDLPSSEADVSAPPCSTVGGPPATESEEQLGEVEEEERHRQLLRERWLTVTGRKPRNVPTVKRQQAEEVVFVHFGDRRPLEVEQKVRENLLTTAGKMKPLVPNFGKVQKELTLPALCDGLLCVRFDQEGETLSTAYRDGGVEVRKATSGEVVQTLWTIEKKSRMPVRALQYSLTDRNILYVAGAMGIVQVFKISTAECIKITNQSLNQINTMDLTASGENLVTAGRRGVIGVLDPETLELKSMRMWPQLDTMTQPDVEDKYHKMRIYALRCHPTDPNLFVTASWDSTVKIWDIRVQEAIRSIRGPMVYGEGVDIVENTIVTASWRVEDSLHFWDLPSGKLIKHVPIHTKSSEFDGEFLYVARFFSDAPNSLLNSDCIAVGGSGFTSALVINTNTEKIIAAFPTRKAVLTLDVSGNAIAYGGKESLFRIGEVVISEMKRKKK